jgi:hypothetical protein
VTTIDVSQIIGKAPVQIMAIHWDPVQHPERIKEAAEGGKKLDYLYDIEIWHERTMPAVATPVHTESESVEEESLS